MTSQLPDSEEARIVKRAMPTADRRAVSLADMMALGVLLGGTPVASVSSASQLRAMAARAAGLLPAGFRQEATLEKFAALGGFSPEQAVALRRRQLEHRLTSLAFFLKQLAGKSVYEIAVEGEEHIDGALAGGRGAVIWIADFVFASEVVRQAFHGIGHPLTHMIRPEHGFSSTQVGLKYLNPLHRKAGDRYVREYIVFDRDRPDDARQRLERRLSENGMISILACAYEGRTLVQTPFLRGRLPLAIGAPAIAFKMGCPILPVFAMPSPAAPNFTVSIGSPLTMTSTDRHAAMLEATKDFVSRLAPRVEAQPDLWRGWPSLT